MRRQYILSFILILKIKVFLCLQNTLDPSLASNNSYQGWNEINKIHENCFACATRIIIFSNDWQKESELLRVSVNSSTSFIFGKEASTTLQKYQRFRHVYKLKSIHASQRIEPANSVTIFIGKDTNLSELLTSLQNSIWWNSNARYLIVGFDESSCELAYGLLNIAWNFKILSAIFLCQDFENNRNFYTFNPYSNAAPSFWKNVDADMQADNKWSLFHHTVESISPSYNSSLCDTLYFDKLQNMHGYTLKTNLIPYPAYYDKNRIGYERSSFFISQVFKAMNAIYTVKFIDFKGLIDSNGQPYDDINEIISGKVDFFLFPIFIREYWWLQAYPFTRTEIKILTLSQSAYSIDFSIIFKPSMWLLLALLIVLTILSLQYILKSTFVSGSFEFVRIFTNSASIREPRRNFERICFILLIYFWMIVNIYIQSNFSADKIVIKERKSIDSNEDLKNTDLTIFGFSSNIDMISNEDMRKRFVAYERSKCVKRLLNKENIACLIPGVQLIALLPENGPVHISKGSLVERDFTWLFSEDSPLLPKVNSISSRFKQAGIISYLKNQKKLNYHEITEHIDSSDFVIALRILIGGWILALVVAAIEIIIGMIKRLCTRHCQFTHTEIVIHMDEL